jgi:hypothetical protein
MDEVVVLYPRKCTGGKLNEMVKTRNRTTLTLTNRLQLLWQRNWDRHRVLKWTS